MRLRHLSLTHFRTYHSLELDFPAGPILLHGQNAQGKTSLLEAIYYLAAAHSPQAASDRQVINWLALRSEPRPFAKIVGEVETAQAVVKLEVRLILEPSPATRVAFDTPIGVRAPGSSLDPTAAGGRAPEARFKKEVFVNAARKPVAEMRGRLNAVLFLPQDMALVEGSPSERRRFMDDALCQVDAAYCEALSEYGKVLTQRNALLRQLQERGGDPAQLDFWDAQLAQHGAALVQARALFLAEVEMLAAPIHRQLTAGVDSLRLDYHPSFDPVAPPEGQLELGLGVPVSRLGLAREEVRARLLDRLSANRPDDLARGVTTLGPHRDEVRFLASGVDLGLYGSRGQNRTAVLALKLAEMEWMQSRAGEFPILLLDEVLAELDTARRRDLLARVNGAEQAVMTTTDLTLFEPGFREKAAVWRVEAGRISMTNDQ